jgi:hypothetical protein
LYDVQSQIKKALERIGFSIWVKWNGWACRAVIEPYILLLKIRILTLVGCFVMITHIEDATTGSATVVLTFLLKLLGNSDYQL